MRIQCDVCQAGAASVICCADEAALCADCDVDVHAANKVAGKHHRLPLHNESRKLPRCDICQEKAAFIFCVEDRALLCGRCDEPIHSPGTLAAKHQRFLATGITIAAQTRSFPDLIPPLPHSSAPPALETATPSSAQGADIASNYWTVDDLCLPVSDFVPAGDKGDCASFGEFDWNMMGEMEPLTIGGFHEPAQVPELPSPLPAPTATVKGKLNKSGIPLELDESFVVPDIEAQPIVDHQAPPPPKRRSSSYGGFY